MAGVAFRHVLVNRNLYSAFHLWTVYWIQFNLDICISEHVSRIAVMHQLDIPPPGDNRGNAGSCTSYSLHFSTAVGEVYTSPLSPGVKRRGEGGHYCGKRSLFSRGIFCNFFIPSCRKEICFAKCPIVASSRVASYYVSYFSSCKWPFCLITLYDVFIWWTWQARQLKWLSHSIKKNPEGCKTWVVICCYLPFWDFKL